MPTILPLTFPPAGYFSAAPTQGSAINCFIPSDTRCFSLSNFRMMTSTSCSGFTTSEGCFTRPQLRSVKCSKPSIPPRSTNAPYSVTFFTWPCTTWPSLSVSINAARLACNSSSSRARRLTPPFPRRRFSLVTRTWISVPVKLSRFCAGRKSYCEPGRNALTPISTTMPPLMRSTTLPVIVSLALNAASIFSHVRRRNTFRYDRMETVFVLSGALHLDGAVRLGPRYFRVRKFRRGNQPFRLSAQVHHHAMFREGDNLDLNHFVRGSRFLLLVVLLQQLAHLFRAGRFFIGGGRFGIRCMRLPASLSCGVSSRGIRGRARLLGRSRRRRFRHGARCLGSFRCRWQRRLLCRAFYRWICFRLRIVGNGFGFGRGLGGGPLGLG